MKLLFLAHRMPYPPNKGDKIRSFHILRFLSQHFSIKLGAFVDNAEDWRYRANLEELCEEVFLMPLHRKTATLRSLTGLVTGEALTLPYYGSAEMAKWARQQLAGVDAMFVFSSSMAQHIPADATVPTVVDYVDLDSQKWLEYGERKSWPMSWIYGREARLLAKFEGESASHVRKILFVSKAEADLFIRDHPHQSEKVDFICNGVDADFFDAALHFENPYAREHQCLVFTGLMDYWPNVDAVTWFVRDVLPGIVREVPTVRFYIVGANPATEVCKLDQNEHVTVTGTVPDVRPYVAHAKCAVAPLRVGRGIQNKVLEAMALGKPIVATGAAMEGINGGGRIVGCVSDDPRSMASACTEYLLKPTSRCDENRCFVLDEFDWERNLSRLPELLMANDRGRIVPG